VSFARGEREHRAKGRSNWPGANSPAIVSLVTDAHKNPPAPGWHHARVYRKNRFGRRYQPKLEHAVTGVTSIIGGTVGAKVENVHSLTYSPSKSPFNC
jgi:hypothetical protein